MARPTPLRVFLAHAKEDKSIALEIYHLLKLDGFEPWIDKENLLTGHAWELEIEKAVQSSHALIAFISSLGMNRAGYLHKELALALDLALRQPEGEIFILPMCLDGCEPPKRLAHLKYSGFPRDSVADIYTTLQSSILNRAAALGLVTKEQLQEMPTTPVLIKGWTPLSLRPGRYLVRGHNPDSSKYYGVATVKRSGDDYLVSWEIGEQRFKGNGQAPRNDELVRLCVEGEYKMIFSRESWSGVYEGAWGGGGKEEFIPASPTIRLHLR